MAGSLPIAFSGSPLDRADNIRADRDALGALMNWKAKFLLLDQLMPLLDDAGRLSWGTLADAHEDAELVFLGLDRSEGEKRRALLPSLPKAMLHRVWQTLGCGL